MPMMPDAWIFESLNAVFDVDNILLSEMTPQVHEATYILTNIKMDGFSTVREASFAEGVELALVDAHGDRRTDTIAMMFNGYWQLSATPGQWTIQLGGRNSKVIYKKVKHVVAVASFAEPQVKLSLKFNPGMEHLKVYNLSVADTSNATTVNVFAVTSGHLYERLVKIMMLSVRRQTKYNVKFWMLKAYLSPQFKAALPKMAKTYNFSYQLVSYQWPLWLRPQVEKQRVMWGNKILLLDMLFPLELDRVVYLDSDQIVRTDLIELMRMKFDDAPYAFTPFCDSRTDTEPFRFWKQGYWQMLLQGKNYHISALFAIDLPKFRQLGAGDWLRWHYQQLSQDAASLANLDQDLPNYAQVHIPIFSLPQNWLWCETWCSNESMAKAKTIDLCNNPLTKVSKLQIAKTRVREWPALDREVRNITADPGEYEKFFF
jgi:UDP-glucose:glycoprotein glucosyltransferase